jgi:ubiquitin carboxyl-terminal hydrolase MINDY-1/2
LQDISSIKSFLESYPTQITPYGLDIINESLFPGAFAILFRNDHFSTIYKHPESGQLFTLVTDAGYSDKDEVIWESLVDVSGQNSEFFSGDFRPVGNVDGNDESQQHQQNTSITTVQRSAQSNELSSPVSPQELQQQADADFAMALQLQEEEEARIDDSRRRSSGNGLPQNRNPPTLNQRVREQDASRPAIPPRNTRNQGVNRPVDSNLDEAPPPAYEEAAKGKPYLPPVGHPQHPSFDGRSPISGPSTPMHPPGPRNGPVPPRRMSAFHESSQYPGTPPLTRPQTNSSIGVGQHSGRPKERDKDCIVM